MEKIMIQKRDGASEEYRPEKIEKVTQAAGLTKEQALGLVDEINEWLTSLGKDTVSSLDLRIKVLTLLKEKSDYAAGLFEWYEKSKDGKNER